MHRRSKKQQVIDLVKSEAIVRPRDLIDLGLPGVYLYALAKQGIIEQIGRGLYQWPKKDFGQYQSLLEASKRAPGAVVALLSALNYHGMTTENPHEIWLAIDRKQWRPKISYPPVRFVTMSGEAFTSGIKEYVIDGTVVKIFSPAKTVVDCFKYRHKIGLDVALDAFRDGWASKKFTMDEILKYAEICRVKKVMQPYLESLV